MNEQFKKTSVANLMKMWVDMMRPHTQHTIDDNCKQWNPLQTYNKCIENIESVISQKSIVFCANSLFQKVKGSIYLLLIIIRSR